MCIVTIYVRLGPVFVGLGGGRTAHISFVIAQKISVLDRARFEETTVSYLPSKLFSG